MAVTSVVSLRKKEIVLEYFTHLNHHIQELKNGKAKKSIEIREFAAMMYIHPGHLSNTIKEVSGCSTCDHFESRLLAISKELLMETRLPIAHIATRLFYDPSNFTKFFKAYAGMTPKKFREINNS